MVKSSDFELSRIYASGWSAGRNCNIEDTDDLGSLVEATNPYTSKEDRDRWSQGFRDFMARCGGIR